MILDHFFYLEFSNKISFTWHSIIHRVARFWTPEMLKKLKFGNWSICNQKQTYWIVMGTKTISYSNVGSLNLSESGNSFCPSHQYCQFLGSSNPEIANTVDVGKKECHIRIQWPKLTRWTKFWQHNYPKSLIFEIHRSANYRISAFLNISCVQNLPTMQKPWVWRKTWIYFWILDGKLIQKQCL